jgi:hypothetical protein
MSQKTPHTQLPSAPSQQVTTGQSSDPAPATSQNIQNMSRRGSARSSKPGSTPVLRSNSISKLRRSSRASSGQHGTDQVHDEQSLVGIPEEFDLGYGEWCNKDFSDLDFDSFNVHPLDDAAVGTFDYFSYNPFGDHSQLYALAQSSEGNWQGQPDTAFEFQQGQSFEISDEVIDPALLSIGQQPQDTYVANYPTLRSTPGLTAVPGEVNLMPLQPMQPAQVEHVYPDPTGVYPMQQPYYFPRGYQPHPAFQPHQGYQQQHYAPVPYATRADLAPPIKPNKRARPDSDSESDAPVKKVRLPPQPIRNESEDESDGIVITKEARARLSKRLRRESRDSGASSSSSLSKPHGTKANVGQKPQKCEEKPWVRINTNTKGETTRTARINGEANQMRKYKSKPLPHGNWDSNNSKFEYTTHNGLDEFVTKRMSPQQIKEYITQYPSDDLTLWLQVSPADMARRYGSPGHSKCLFRDCPKHVWGDSGTIDVGHYRIAFDEKFKLYGNKIVDPFDCPGFVHLYCLERFCDFERICRETNVRVDTRVDLPREASQAKWTMSGRPETDLAQYFIKACRKGKLRETDEFAHYPVHQSSKVIKDFKYTLAHALAKVNIDNRTRSQMCQFVNRKLTPNVFMISRGDMEIAMTLKKIKKEKVFKKAQRAGQASQFDFAAHYDKYDPIINKRIGEYMGLKAKLDAEDAQGRVPRRTKAKSTGVSKRKTIAIQDSDSDSEPEFNDHNDSDLEEISPMPMPYNVTAPSRSSPRKPARINYSLDAPPPPMYQQAQQYQHPLPSIAMPQDPYQGYIPTQQPHRQFSISQLQRLASLSEPERLGSVSHLFPTDMSLNIDDVLTDAADARSNTTDGPPVTQAEFDEMMLRFLERRKSSTLSLGPVKAAMRSPGLRSPGVMKSPRVARQASFNVQPVSQSKEFGKDDPPSKVASVSVEPRRSSRLKEKAV